MKINIIGAGHWGPNLIRNFANLPDVTVGKVADLDTERLNQIQKKMPGVETTTDSATAINDPTVDAVAIVTPVSTHHKLAKAALNAGKHVFLEKPLCSTVEECNELIALAAEKNLVLMVGHVFLFNPGIQKIKEILDCGVLGKVFYVDAVRTNLGPIRQDVNALWDLAPHDFSILNYLFGEQACAVSSTGSRVYQTLKEDVVFATVKYPSGLMAHIHSSWLNPKKVRQITIIGEKKMLVWDDMDLNRMVQIYDHGFKVHENFYSDSFASHRLQCFQGDLTIPRVFGEEPLLAECRHFVECIKDGIPCRANAHTGREVVKILTAADISINNQGQFTLIK